MHDIDSILFGNQDWIPILMPEHITNLQKANKRASPKKKREKADKNDSEEDGPKDLEESSLAKIQSNTTAKKGLKKNE